MASGAVVLGILTVMGLIIVGAVLVAVFIVIRLVNQLRKEPPEHLTQPLGSMDVSVDSEQHLTFTYITEISNTLVPISASTVSISGNINARTVARAINSRFNEPLLGNIIDRKIREAIGEHRGEDPPTNQYTAYDPRIQIYFPTGDELEDGDRWFTMIIRRLAKRTRGAYYLRISAPVIVMRALGAKLGRTYHMVRGNHHLTFDIPISQPLTRVRLDEL